MTDTTKQEETTTVRDGNTLSPEHTIATPPAPSREDQWIAAEEARLRRQHAESNTTRPYYSGD